MSVKKVLKLNDWRVKQTLQEFEAIKGKKIIGRGVFSVVFEGSRKNTVIKVTADPMSYWMLNCYAYGVTHRHFPKVKNDFGEIGSTRIGKVDVPIYAFETERLYPLETGSKAKKTARIIRNVQSETSSKNFWKHGYQHLASVTLYDMQKTITIGSVKNALAQLCDFCGNYLDAGLDMHMGNFMQRKNGELVITDPILDRSLIAAISKR